MIQNPYSHNDGSKFVDYVYGNKVSKQELINAKSTYPNVALSQGNILNTLVNMSNLPDTYVEPTYPSNIFSRRPV